MMEAQPRHLGIATVEDDHIRFMLSQALCDHLVPDGITRQIEGFLLRVGEDHTTHFTQPLGQRSHDLIVAVLPLGLLQADTGKFDLLAQQAHIFEATGTYGVGIFLMLHKQRQMLGDLLLSDLVPVVHRESPPGAGAARPGGCAGGCWLFRRRRAVSPSMPAWGRSESGYRHSRSAGWRCEPG